MDLDFCCKALLREHGTEPDKCARLGLLFASYLRLFGTSDEVMQAGVSFEDRVLHSSFRLRSWPMMAAAKARRRNGWIPRSEADEAVVVSGRGISCTASALVRCDLIITGWMSVNAV